MAHVKKLGTRYCRVMRFMTRVPFTTATMVPLLASSKLKLSVPTTLADTDDESNGSDWNDDPEVTR